jgi:hypothetical protein
MVMKNIRYTTDNQDYDNLDKLRAFYIEGKELSDLQHKKRLQYEAAHCLLLEGYSRQQTINFLIKRKIIESIPVGYRVINTAEMLFGHVGESNKKGIRHILHEIFMTMYRRAIKAKDLREANRALENVAKIYNLYKEDEFDWQDVVIPTPVFTTNPRALRKDNREN